MTEMTSNIVEPKPAPVAAPVNGAAAPPAKVAVGSPPAPTPADAPKPAVEEPKAETPREGKLLAAVRAKEKANLQRDQQLARREQELKAREGRHGEESTKVAERERLAATDPLTYLKKIHGWTDDALAQRLVNGNKADPGEKQTALERKIEALESKLAEKDKSESSQRAATHRDQLLETFAKTAKGDAERWPLASKYKDAKLKARGWDIAAEHGRQQIQLSDEEILDKLEEELAEIVAITKENGSKTTEKTATEAKPGQSTEAAPTLAGIARTSTDTGESPPGPDASDSERTAFTLRKLKEMRARGELRE